MLNELASSDFDELLNQAFQICAGEQRFDAELVEVVELESSQAPGSGRARPFSIVLRAAAQPLLPQSIYAVEHPGLGTIEMFLVPVGPDDEGMRYEAVFN